MRRVIGNAAHQLRTPVTGLMSQMEMLSLQTSEPQRQKHMDKLHALTVSLGRLVGQLINHAMVQHRASNAVTEQVDLAALVRNEMAEILSQYSHRKLDELDVGLEAPSGPCLIAGDLTALREAIKNLIGNALLHGAPGLLHAEIAAMGDDWMMRFIDDGPGIGAEAAARVREPFSARAGNRGGASLGLAIVEQVVTSHGGEMTFLTNQAGHFVVQLRFPRLKI